MIEEALAAVEERDKAIAHIHAQPIALVGQAFCFSKGMKDAELGWFSPTERQNQAEFAARIIPAAVAQTVLELAQDNKLPSWIIEVVNMDLIRRSAATIEA